MRQLLSNAALVFLFAMCAFGDIISPGLHTSTAPDLGNFTGTIDYTDINATSATLKISLTNTTDPSVGFLITGFVFNNPSSDITSATMTATPTQYNTSFQFLGVTNDGIAGSPFGQFDVGAALGGNFLGGGSPNAGIPVGGSGQFTFNLSGTNLNQLTTQSFETALSCVGGSCGANGNTPEAFVVRFRGGVGSDKITGTFAPSPVPEPSSMLLFGTGLLGMAVLLRRRRRLTTSISDGSAHC